MNDPYAQTFEKTNAGVVLIRFAAGMFAATLAGVFPGLLVGSIAGSFADPWRGADERFYWTIGMSVVVCLGARVAWLGAARSLGAAVALWGVSSIVAIFTSIPAVYFYFVQDGGTQALIWVLFSIAVTANIANAFVWILNRGFRVSAPSATSDQIGSGIRPTQLALRVIGGLIAAAVGMFVGLLVVGAFLEFFLDPYSETGQFLIVFGGVLGAALGPRIAWIGATNDIAASVRLQIASSLVTGLVVLPIYLVNEDLLEDNFVVFWIVASVVANVMPAAQWTLLRRRGAT